MLGGVDHVVAKRRVVQQRQVPEPQIGRPQRQRDERVGEHAQAPDSGERQDGDDGKEGGTRLAGNSDDIVGILSSCRLSLNLLDQTRCRDVRPRDAQRLGA